MACARRLGHTALVAALLTLSGACRPAAPAPGGPEAGEEDLAHFDGVMDYGRQTTDPVLSDLYVRAARALEAGDAAGAEALYREAIAKYPKDPDGYEALGACLAYQKRYDEARAEYERALTLDPRSADAHYGLGSVAYDQDRYAEARDHLLRALEVREAHGLTHRLLALVYDQLREPAKARAHYERAAALSPRIAAEEHVRRRLAELAAAGDPEPDPGGKK